MKKLIIVRHGKTKWNTEGYLMGHQEVGLSEEGKEELKELKKEIITKSVEHVFCSTSERTLETAKILNEQNIPQTNLDHLRERNQGVLEGMKITDIEKDYKDFWNPKNKKEVWFSKADKAESLYEVLIRTMSALKIILDHPAKTVLVVTHGTPMRLMQFIFSPNKADCDIFKFETPHGDTIEFANPIPHYYTLL